MDKSKELGAKFSISRDANRISWELLVIMEDLMTEQQNRIETLKSLMPDEYHRGIDSLKVSQEDKNRFRKKVLDCVGHLTRNLEKELAEYSVNMDFCKR